MARLEDTEVTKTVWREFARRPVDISLMSIVVIHGVVYLRGQVKAMRGHTLDLRSEMEIIAKALKQRPGIRDVIMDLTYRT
ncbi:MAG TPA: hypothetical protein VNK96_05430 [Fimbriimonadales bacterium]|nr:hypothetical protein [Fimbriimonadales bacterium]